MKRWKRFHSYGLLFAFGVPFLVHWIPNSYRVRQRYELTGNLANPVEAPNQILSAIEKEIALPESERSGTCRINEGKDTLECSFGLSRRIQARKLDQVLRETLPKKYGWIEAAQVDQKMTQANRTIASNVEEMRRLEIELAERRKTAETEDQQIGTIERERQQLQTDLSNRGRQLDVIREGIASGRSEKMMSVFKTKEAEVLRSMNEIKKELETIDKQLTEVSAPRQKRQAIEEKLIALRNETDLARARISAWSSLKQNDPTSPLLPDPDTFRLKPTLSSDTVRSVRDFAHVIWSLPLGLLLFAIVRRRRPDLFSAVTFATPEEVAAATALPYLGPVPK